MQVHTDHKIIPYGLDTPGVDDRLDLVDSGSGELIAQAIRIEGQTTWKVTAEGVPDLVATTTSDAVTGLTTQALMKLRGTVDAPGFSTWAPNEVTMRDD